jgi:rubrerythrin
MARKKHPSVSETPQLAAEWDGAKNKIQPSDVTLGSSLKVAWCCSKCGNKWSAKVNSRGLNHSGCPVCSLKERGEKITLGKLKASPGESIAVLFPDLLKEWDYDKNKLFDPIKLRPGSSQKVTWKCGQCGHTWDAKIYHRTRSGSGCPKCGRRKSAASRIKTMLKSQGSLAEKFPLIAQEWHPTLNRSLTPDKVLPHSGKKVWWLCKKGHKFQQVVGNRTGLSQNCPMCNSQTSRLEVRIYTELSSLFENTNWRSKVEGNEVDVLVKSIDLAIEIDGYPWHEGKEDADKLKSQIFKKHGLGVLRLRHEKLSDIGDNTLNFNSKSDPVESVFKIVQWIIQTCNLDPKQRKKCESYLEKKRPIAEEEFLHILSFLPAPIPENSLPVLHPKLAAQWDNRRNGALKPESFSIGSGYKAWWKCSNNHHWQATIEKRVSGTGCPYCSRKKATGKNNIATEKPELLELWDYDKNKFRPEELLPGSNHVAWWKCSKGHSYSMEVKLVSRGVGCPFCSGKRVDKTNSFEALYPKFLVYWNVEANLPITPSNTTRSSGKKIHWKCPTCSHQWLESPSNAFRRKRIFFCPNCRKINKNK